MIVIPAAAVMLGWVAVQLLWQGAVIGGAVAVLRRVTSCGPAARYRIGCAALVLLVGLAAIDFAVAWAAFDPGPRGPVVSIVPTMAAGVPVSIPDGATRSELAELLPPNPRAQALALAALAVVWAIAAAAMLLRLFGGWWLVRGIVRRSAPLATQRRAALEAAVPALRSPVARRTRLQVSREIDVPAAMGARRPAIVLPAACIESRDDEDLGSLVAHELAHVARHDFAVNLAQSIVEALTLRHPGVTWISTRIRRDRERCADELAARWLGSRARLARSLVDLEWARCHPQAMAANRGNLTARIRRLLASPPRPTRPRDLALVAAVLLTVVATSLAATDAARVPVPRRLLYESVDAVGRPELVLGGLDPVLLLGGERTGGSERHELQHRGHIYRFASRGSRARFAADPDRYAVVNAAICPVTGELVEPDTFRVIDGRIYLFCCENARRLPSAEIERLLIATR